MRNASARTHTHTHTPKGHVALLTLSSSQGSRGLSWSENDTLGQERRKRHQNSTRNATSPRCKVPSASALQDIIDISLTQNSLSVSASRLSPACDEQVVCPYSWRNRPRCGLRIFGTPCRTSHPTSETARPPLQAKLAPSALLASSLWHADLRHSMPHITSHLGKGTARAPSKARAVCVARLRLLGNTSNTVQSAA